MVAKAQAYPVGESSEEAQRPPVASGTVASGETAQLRVVHAYPVADASGNGVAHASVVRVSVLQDSDDSAAHRHGLGGDKSLHHSTGDDDDMGTKGRALAAVRRREFELNKEYDDYLSNMRYDCLCAFVPLAVLHLTGLPICSPKSPSFVHEP